MTLHCGQSCPGERPYWPRLRPMGQLAAGDVIPGCNHRVRTSIVTLVRQGRNDSVYRVVTAEQGAFSREPWEIRLYGAPFTMIEVE